MLDTTKNALHGNYSTAPEELARYANVAIDDTSSCPQQSVVNESAAVDTVVTESPESVRLVSEQEIDDLIYYTILSASSYCHNVIPGATWNCPYCNAISDLEIVKTWSTRRYDTNAMIARSDDKRTMYLVFRGSYSIRCKFNIDLMFLEVLYTPVDGAKVYKGFLNSYEELQSDLVNTVTDQLEHYPDYKVAVTGHSLGGATALLCALDLYQTVERLIPTNLFLYTQGQPRVGNSVSAEYVVSTRIPYKRVVNKHDLIPRLPPASLGYLHAREEYWIVSDDHDTVLCTSKLESPHCSNTIVPSISITQHYSYFGMVTGLCPFESSRSITLTEEAAQSKI